MKITEQTTFAELQFEKQRLGITHLLISERPRPKQVMTIEHLVEVSIVSNDGKMIRTSGGTIEGTLSEAFAEREAEIGRLVTTGKP
jgi:hypothetical protein